MIVIIGAAHLRGEGPDAVPGGTAGRVAVAAAAAGARVELVAKVGDDPVGDELLLALARAGVGHVAVLRDGVHRTRRAAAEDEVVDGPDGAAVVVDDAGVEPVLEPADVRLALRYLTETRVLVVVEPSPEIAAEAVAAADWAGARLIVTTPGGDGLAGLPEDATVIAIVPDEGPGGADAVSARLGAFAAALDRGDDPALAYDGLTAPVV